MRVVDSEDAPIGSCALTVAFATRRPDGVEARKYGPYELTTDERGELDLATLLDGLAQRLERVEHMALIALRAREELTPSVLERSALGAARELAAVVVRKPRALAPLRGIAVDAQTGAPLADCPLRIVLWQDARAPAPAPGLTLARPDVLRLDQRVEVRGRDRFCTRSRRRPLSPRVRYDRFRLRDDDDLRRCRGAVRADPRHHRGRAARGGRHARGRRANHIQRA